MADLGVSVLARLKNKAAKSGRSYQLCMQLFCQEEFLRKKAGLYKTVGRGRAVMEGKVMTRILDGSYVI